MQVCLSTPLTRNGSHAENKDIDLHTCKAMYLRIGLGGESPRETFTILHYASLAARSLSSLVAPQCNPTMCNRTSCAQVHELP